MIILAATPIGNLGDASRRLVEALEAATVIAAEDTRTTQRLLAGLGVANRPRLIALHDHNEKERAGELVEPRARPGCARAERCGHADGERSGLRAGRGGRGCRRDRHGDPRSQRGARRARGLGTAHRPVHVRGLPAAQARGATRSAAQPRRRAAHHGLLRIARPGGGIPRRHGRGVRRRAPRRRLPRADQAVRGGRARHGSPNWPSGPRPACAASSWSSSQGAPAAQITFPDAVTQVLELVRSGTRLKDAAGEVSAHTGHSSRELYQAALAVKG